MAKRYISKVGKRPIFIPDGVEVKHDPTTRTISAKGKLGELSLTYLPAVKVNIDTQNKQIIVEPNPETHYKAHKIRAMHGLYRQLINNLVVGVSQGFKKEIHLYRARTYKAELKGRTLVLHLGYSHPIEYPLPDGIECKLEPLTQEEINRLRELGKTVRQDEVTKIIFIGADKQLVGEVAAQVRRLRPFTVYKDKKGMKYPDEVIIFKKVKDRFRSAD